MSEDTKQPGSEEPTSPGVSDSEASGTPPPSAIPPAGTLAGADEEKAAMVEQAKSRVAAVKESLQEQPAGAGAPKPPVKKKFAIIRFRILLLLAVKALFTNDCLPSLRR